MLYEKLIKKQKNQQIITHEQFKKNCKESYIIFLVEFNIINISIIRKIMT